jgi:diguanylate cyclase (GGDEF)-like protein
VLSNDLTGRIGGEESAVFLLRIAMDVVWHIAECLCVEIETAAVDRDEQNAITVTASFGIASAEENGFDLLEMLKSADQGLYSAKAEGGNTVIASASA